VGKHLSSAVWWYSKAADLWYALAMSNLGAFLENGRWVGGKGSVFAGRMAWQGR
jgi:TPR repeat protein